MKTATLAIIVQDGKVLLGLKKQGEIGIGTWNGPGGKMEAEDLEDPVRCVIRETHEETGGAVMLVPTQLTKLGILQCYAGGIPHSEVHVFYVETHDLPSEIRETEDMRFAWYPIHDLPLDHMLGADRDWFPSAVTKQPVNMILYYEEPGKGYQAFQVLSP